MALFLASYLQPWVASLIVAGVLVILVTLCACQGEKDTRIQDFGIPGRLSSITVDTVTQPIIDSCNGRPVSALTDTSAGSDGQTCAVTDRALPDIPQAPHVQLLSCDTDTDQTPDSGSECYATVTKREVLENGCLKDRAGIQEPQVLASMGLPVTVEELACEAVSQPSTSQEQFSSQQLEDLHPYAKVQKNTRHPFSSALESDDSDHADSNDNSQASNHPIALLADPSEESHAIVAEEPSASVSGTVPKEIPYTVISVREPLERVRMQTRQQIRERQHLNKCSSADEPEGYYMEVPEEEQTYAEIYSGQNSAKSSATYDLIEPSNNPPDPPTVESLRFVAIAHSRQASIVSESSFGSANTSAMQTVDIENEDSAAMEKARNGTANVPTATTSEKKEYSDEIHSINLEDLYAKVHKKRVEGTMSVSGIEDVLNLDTDTDMAEDVFASARTSLSSSTKSRTPLPTLLPSSSSRLIGTNRTLVRRHSAEPSYSESDRQVLNSTEPFYASVIGKSKSREPEYEQIKRSEPNKEDVEPGYESINRKRNDSDHFPGYESVKRKNADCEVEPGYELVSGNSLKDEADPGYECVNNLDHSSSDPGYERIQRVERSESDVVDPGYESVRRVKRETDRSDPDYECISFGQHASDSEGVDAGYEQVGRLNHSGDNGDTGYEHLPFRSKPDNCDNAHEAAGNVSFEIPEAIDVHFTDGDSESALCNGTSSSTCDFSPSYSDSFVSDKISLNVPYLGVAGIVSDTFLTVRVKSSGPESTVNYSASIVEVECSPRSPTRTQSSPFSDVSKLE